MPLTPSNWKLEVKQIIVLLPNTTLTTHLLDQGVIRSLKTKYCKNIVPKIIRSLVKNKALPTNSILNGMQMLVSAWNSVSIEAVVNCFCKPRISSANKKIAIVEDNDPLKNFHDEINTLWNVQPDLVPEDVNTYSLTDTGYEVSAVQVPLTDSNILTEFFETGNISNGDDKIIDASNNLEEEPMECRGKTDLLNALELFQKFFSSR